jgi:hypothetical protein
MNRCALEAVKCSKLEGVSGLELVDAAWLPWRKLLLGRAGFVNLKPYPNRTSRQQSGK